MADDKRLVGAGEVVRRVIPAGMMNVRDALQESEESPKCLKCLTVPPILGEKLCASCLKAVTTERHEKRIGMIPAHLGEIGVPPVFQRPDLPLPGLAKPFIEGTRGLCLHGPVGVGKSMTMGLLVRDWLVNWSAKHGGIEKGLPSMWRWVDWVEFTMELQDAYLRGDGERTAYRQLRAVADTPIIVIDDLGAEQNKTPFIKQATYLLLDRREKWGLQTFVTTNLSLTLLDREYGARISDRLAKLCEVAGLRGASRRLS